MTTSDRVTDFCTREFRDVLGQYGLKVVPADGDVVIDGEVLEFMVTEKSRYEGAVRLKVSVRRHGAVAWTGTESGNSSHWGRSYKAENYYEALSDAFLQAVENTLRDEGFRKAAAK